VPAEPAATLVDVDATHNVAEASPSATATPMVPVDKAVTIPTEDIDGDDSSQPPPDPPANTERTCTVHFADTTDEEDAPTAGGAPDDPDDDDDSDDEDDYDDDEPDEKDWTAIYVMEQNTDLADYIVTEVDRRLDRVYGDHAHSNADTHLSGGIERDKLWQARWLEVMQLATTTYLVPKGRVGRRFCKYLTLLWKGVRL
jgi:hypothetical protein